MRNAHTMVPTPKIPPSNIPMITKEKSTITRMIMELLSLMNPPSSQLKKSIIGPPKNIQIKVPALI